MRYFVIFLILVVSIVMVAFGAQNTQTVKVQFFTYNSGEVSLSLVVILSAVGGAVITALVSIWNGIQTGMRERAFRRRMEQKTRELEQRLLVAERHNSTMKLAIQTQARAAAAAATDQRQPK